MKWNASVILSEFAKEAELLSARNQIGGNSLLPLRLVGQFTQLLRNALSWEEGAVEKPLESHDFPITYTVRADYGYHSFNQTLGAYFMARP